MFVIPFELCQIYLTSMIKVINRYWKMEATC